MLRLLLVALVAAVAAPAAAHAAPLRVVRYAAVSTQVVGYDDRYMVLAPARADDPFRVIDTSGGPDVTLVPPTDGCSVVDVHAGEVLWDRCGLTDIRTGVNAPLPAPVVTDVLDMSGGPPGVRYSSLGSRWIGLTASGYHYAVPYVLDRATGVIKADPATYEYGQSSDLDDPDLVQPLCAGVKRPSVPGESAGSVPGPLIHQGAWWIGVSGGDPDEPLTLRLQRCGRAPIVVRHALRADNGARFPSAAPDGFVAWTVPRPKGGHLELDVRTLRTGETRRLRLNLRQEDAQLLAVGAKLFIPRRGRLDRVLLGTP